METTLFISLTQNHVDSFAFNLLGGNMNIKSTLSTLIPLLGLLFFFDGNIKANNFLKKSVNDDVQKTKKNQCLWSRQYPVNSGQSEAENHDFIAKFKKPYTYYMNASEIGAAGLFTVFDAHLLRKGEFRVSVAPNRFYRYPGVRITQVPISFTCGVFQNLEFFFSTNVNQDVRTNSPQFLSGGLLSSAISTGNFQAANLVNANAVTNGFFLLPGLPVSGATGGGVLPGLVRGTPRQVFDPVLNTFKNAYEKAGFPNNMPFLARSGNNYGETIIGVKLFNINLRENEKVSFLTYARIPSRGIGDVLINPNNALYTGASAGKTDFGFFILHSYYITRDDEETTEEVLGDSASDQKIKKTFLNIHNNFGLIYNRDPKFNGIKLVDRKNEFVVGTGVDSFFKLGKVPLQFILENRTVVPMGGGTLDIARKISSDFTVGFRMFPPLKKEIPADDKIYTCEEKVKEQVKKEQNQFFWSLGAGYRYTLGVPNNLSDLAKSNHGFTFQFSVGRVGKNFEDSSIKRNCPCQKVSAPKLQIVTEQNVSGGQDKVEVIFSDENEAFIFFNNFETGEGGTFAYQIKPADGEYSAMQKIEDFSFEGTKAIFNLPRNLTLGREYKIKVIAKYIKEKTECKVGEAEIPYKSTNPISSEILPDIIRVSAQRAESKEITAQVQGGLVPYTYQWNIPNGITGIENGAKLTVKTEPSQFKEGDNFPVSLNVTDGSGQSKLSNSSQIKVNYVPTVELKLKDSGLTQIDVEQSQTLSIIAIATDADNDTLTFTDWTLTGKTFDGQPIDLTGSYFSGNSSEQSIDTRNLPNGDYQVSVKSFDQIDYSEAGVFRFRVVPRANPLYFDFDIPKKGQRIFKVNKNFNAIELEKLRKEAEWLRQDVNNSIVIRVEGNADKIGQPKYNRDLGCRRACFVKWYLIHKLGVLESQIKLSVTFGENKADQQSQKADDRRVDLYYTRKPEDANQVPEQAESCDCITSNIKPKKKATKRKKKYFH
jgi:hypothetical protein